MTQARGDLACAQPDDRQPSPSATRHPEAIGKGGAGDAPTRARGFPGWSLPAVAFALTLVVFLPLARLKIDAHHDGLVLKSAIDVGSGQALYRDSFSQYGPLTTYIHVGSMALLGKTLLVMRVVTVLFYAGTLAVLVATWRRFLPTGLVIFGMALWIACAPFLKNVELPLLPWNSAYSLFFQCLALYALVRASAAARPAPWAALCGAAAALTFWCRFQMGVVLAGALLACFALQALRARGSGMGRVSFGPWLLGMAVVHAGFVLILAGTCSLGAWFDQQIRWPLTWINTLESDTGASSDFTNPVASRIVKVTTDLLGTSQLVYSLRWRILSTSRMLGFPLDRLYGPTKDGSIEHPAYVGAGIDYYLVLGLQVLLLGAAVWLVARSWGRRREPGRPVRLGDLPGLALVAGAAAVVFALADGVPASSWAFLVPAGAFAWTAVALVAFLSGRPGWAHGPEVEWAGLLSGVVAMSSWLHYYPVSAHYHHFFAIGPIIGVFALFALRVGRGREHQVAAVLAAALLPLLGVRAYSACKIASQPYREIGPGSVLSGMWVAPEAADQWADLLAAIRDYERRHGPVAVLNETVDGMFGALSSDHANPTPYHVAWRGLPRPADYRSRRDRFIREKKPLIVVESEFAHGRDPAALSLDDVLRNYPYEIDRAFAPQRFFSPQGKFGVGARAVATYLLRPRATNSARGPSQ